MINAPAGPFRKAEHVIMEYRYMSIDAQVHKYIYVYIYLRSGLL